MKFGERNVIDLERHGNFILDNKKQILVNTDSSVVLYFNFEQMYFHIDSKKTKKPIRYLSDENEIAYWAEQKWCKFRGEVAEAITKLFNNSFERQLLNETGNNS